MNPEQAFKIHQEIVQIIEDQNNFKFFLGERFLKLLEDKAFRTIVGDETATISDYLKTPELKIHPSLAWRYMAIVKKYFHELGLTYEDLYGLDSISLYNVAKVVNKDNIKEWLERIRTLSREDIVRLKKFPDADVMTCPHEHKVTLPLKEKCIDCGELLNA